MRSSERITVAIAAGIANAGVVGALSLGMGMHIVWPGMMVAGGLMIALFLVPLKRKAQS